MTLCPSRPCSLPTLLAAKRNVSGDIAASAAAIAHMVVARTSKSARLALRAAPAVLAAACGLAITHASAGITTFSDRFVFETTNQNIWSPGSKIDTGTFNIGVEQNWGSRTRPARFGLDALSGGVTHISPGFPFPDYDLDTRSGAKFNVDTFGSAKLGISAQLSGGQVSATLPMRASLEIAPNRYVARGFDIRGYASTEAGAKMSVTAPSYKVSVGGGLQVDATLSGTGCFIGAGCSSSSGRVNLNGYADNILAVDTSSTRVFSAFGLPIPGVPQLGKPYDLRADASSFYKPTMSPVIGQFTAYQLSDASGEAIVNSRSLTATSRSDLLDVVADVSGMAALGYGSPIDLLNPSLDLKIGKVGLTSVNGRIGVANDLISTYNLDLVVMAKVTFDREISMTVDGMTQGVGRSVTFPVRDGVSFSFVDEIGSAVDHEYFLNAKFTNSGKLVQQLAVNVDTACAQYSFGLDIGSGRECAYAGQYRPATTAEVSMYRYQFDLGGFNPIKIPQFGDVPAVPEPATYAMFLLGLAAGAAARRHGRFGCLGHLDRPLATLHG